MTVRYITPPDTDVLLSGDGCQFSGDAAMFQQTEQTSSPVSDWSWRLLSQPSVVENTVGWPTYRWMPDGHISTLRVTTSPVGRIKCKMSRATLPGSHSTPTTRVTEQKVLRRFQKMPRSWRRAPRYSGERQAKINITMVESGSTLSFQLAVRTSLGLFTQSTTILTRGFSRCTSRYL